MTFSSGSALPCALPLWLCLVCSRRHADQTPPQRDAVSNRENYESISEAGSLAADGEALHSSLLLREAQGGLVGLLNLLRLLDALELDVTVGGEVGADATVSTVGSTAASDGALHDDVVDDALVDVELGSLGVGPEVDEELADAFERLLGPAALGVLELLGLSVASDTASVASEGNNLLVLQAVLHVRDGLLKLHALSGTRHFVSVLVMCTQVRDPALSRYYQKRKCQIESNDYTHENRGEIDIHLAGSAGCLEYLTIANLYLFINNRRATGSVSYY